MWLPSNWTLLYGISIILIIQIETIQTTSNSTKRDEICESLRDNSANKLNILTVGKTAKRLILITNDLYVYDIPIDSLHSAIDKLYLHTKPIPMKQKYPALYHDEKFKDIKNEIFTAFIMTDPDSDWICLVTSMSAHQNGVNYDIDNSQVMQGGHYTGHDDIVLISTSESCQYYSLRSDNSLLINRWQCIESRRLRHTVHISPKSDDSAICHDQTKTKITVERIGRHGIKCRSGIPVQWPILKGFVTDNKFYLFGHSYIYIFDEAVYNNQGEEYPVQKISFDSFFNCAGIIPPSNVISKSYFYWIMGAIILLLVILLAILWCIFVARGHRRMLSFLNGKTGRSGFEEGRSKFNLTKISTNIATTRSRKSTAQQIIQPVMVSSRGNHRSLTGGSAHVTAHTGIDHDNNGYANTTNPNLLKRSATRIPSNGRRDGESKINLTTLIKHIS
uniref:Uncharacterized protein LOC113794908 n=1 Tax=Dermatophagoides pteronyssinus TaxID=6956 RepID=A0A6P6Y8I8_DERPT|nr:uncharacterized protein LOC113794908 [Dermatophagoides pteronyssinus]